MMTNINPSTKCILIHTAKVTLRVQLWY